MAIILLIKLLYHYTDIRIAIATGNQRYMA